MDLALELLLELFGELIVEIGVASAADAWRLRRGFEASVLSVVGFAMAGAVVGGLTLLVFPRAVVHDETLRLIHLVTSPVIAAGALAVLRRVRMKSFGWGTLLHGGALAFMLSLVRYFGTMG